MLINGKTKQRHYKIIREFAKFYNVRQSHKELFNKKIVFELDI